MARLFHKNFMVRRLGNPLLNRQPLPWVAPLPELCFNGVGNSGGDLDNRITVRFYHITVEDSTDGDVDDILQSIVEKELSEREKDIGAEGGASQIVRLERLTRDDDYLCGELTRRQIQNKPPEANSEGLVPLQLSDGGGLGHSTAFRFHRPTSTLALQFNPTGISVGKLRSYLSLWAPKSKFILDRVPTEDALGRFKSGDTRSFEIEIASPSNLPAVEGADDDDAADMTVVEATRMLATAFEGLTVNVTVSMGRRQGELPKGPIEKTIERLIPWRNTGHADVRKLRVKSKPDAGEGEAEYISFLEEFLQEKDILDLPDDNPEENYNIRRNLLGIWHAQHIAYLEDLYG